MSRAIALRIIVLCFILIGGCRSQIDIGQEQKRLLDTDKAFAQKSLNAGAAEAFNEYLADDATQFLAGAQPRSGRESIYGEMKASAGSYILQWEPKASVVSASGDLGYTWGIFTVTSHDSLGKIETRYGKYVNVWKKQADGSWKVVIDIGNQSPPPEAN